MKLTKMFFQYLFNTKKDLRNSYFFFIIFKSFINIIIVYKFKNDVYYFELIIININFIIYNNTFYIIV